MAKEPAGLRRWRLAHRKHKRVRRPKVVRVARRRYGRKRRGGRRGSKAVPVAMVLPIILQAKMAYDTAGGLNSALPNEMVTRFTGYNPKANQWSFDYVKPFFFGEIAGIVAHKVAGKMGVNKHVKKLTLGWLQI